MVRDMHAAGINHRDCYICHFLLHLPFSGKEEELKISVIDLHRAQLRTRVPRRWRDKDLIGLYFSSMISTWLSGISGGLWKCILPPRLKTFSSRNKDCCRKQKQKPQKSGKERFENRCNFRREIWVPTMLIHKRWSIRQSSSMKGQRRQWHHHSMLLMALIKTFFLVVVFQSRHFVT